MGGATCAGSSSSVRSVGYAEPRSFCTSALSWSSVMVAVSFGFFSASFFFSGSFLVAGAAAAAAFLASSALYPAPLDVFFFFSSSYIWRGRGVTHGERWT